MIQLIKKIRARVDKCATGYIPDDFDKRDYLFQAPKSISLPGKINLRDRLPNEDDWKYQGSAGSCVAHAIANQIYAACNKDISRRYLYYYARYLAYNKPPTGDSGCQPRLAYKSLQKVGVPREDFWKYKTATSKLNKRPNYKARKAAYNLSKLQYVRLNKNLTDIRTALTEGYIVAFATQVTQAMYDYRTEGGLILPAPGNSTPLGGHMMAIFGYKKNFFRVANSWRGREVFIMNESWFTWKYTGDFYIIRV